MALDVFSATDSSDDESFEAQWLLGFVDKPNLSLLRRHHFPSKVGGRPAWLDPFHLPSWKQLTCDNSGQPLNFLLQIYATPPALDHIPEAFHRTIFLFISPQGNRLRSPGAVKAFRSQLPRINDYYEPEPTKSVHPMPLQVSHKMPEDRWQVAQTEDRERTGKAGDPSRSKDSIPGPPAPFMYKEMSLVVEPAVRYHGSSDASTDAQTRRLLQEYQERELVQGGFTAEDLPPDVLTALERNATASNQNFTDFVSATSAAPDQVLRYCFEPEAVPVWPGSSDIPGPGDVPECSLCGSPRQFEFQVLPQLLNHLDLDEEDAACPDWGTIAVYTCSRSCNVEGYAEEFVWVQNMT